MIPESFDGAQQVQINAILEQVNHRFRNLTNPERIIFTTVWTTIARLGLPVPFQHAHLQHIPRLNDVLTRLEQRGLVWLDKDMQAILQCPPFSAIQTTHLVKTFGWNTAFACTLVDAPLTLLLYGPNAWLEVNTHCHETHAPMNFRVMLDEYHQLQMETPDDAADWRVWIPHQMIGQAPGPDRVDLSVFATCDALETYRTRSPHQDGVSYTFEEAILLSEIMIRAYKQALSGV